MKTMIRLIVTVFLIVWSVGVSAQNQKLRNQPYADQRGVHFGFAVGLHTQDLVLKQSGTANADGQVWFSEIPSYSPGFSVGLIGDMYLNEYMNLRLVPTLHLGSKQIVFRENASGSEYVANLRNNYFSLPVQVKLAAGRVNNYRPYLVAGGYGSVELGRRKSDVILLKPIDYGVEIGFGCDFYFPMFKLCPELKFTFGLADLLEKNRSDLVDEDLRKYTLSLSRATQRMIVLSFNFE